MHRCAFIPSARSPGSLPCSPTTWPPSARCSRSITTPFDRRRAHPGHLAQCRRNVFVRRRPRPGRRRLPRRASVRTERSSHRSSLEPDQAVFTAHRRRRHRRHRPHADIAARNPKGDPAGRRRQLETVHTRANPTRTPTGAPRLGTKEPPTIEVEGSHELLLVAGTGFEPVTSGL